MYFWVPTLSWPPNLVLLRSIQFCNASWRHEEKLPWETCVFVLKFTNAMSGLQKKNTHTHTHTNNKTMHAQSTHTSFLMQKLYNYKLSPFMLSYHVTQEYVSYSLHSTVHSWKCWNPKWQTSIFYMGLEGTHLRNAECICNFHEACTLVTSHLSMWCILHAKLLSSWTLVANSIKNCGRAQSERGTVQIWKSIDMLSIQRNVMWNSSTYVKQKICQNYTHVWRSLVTE